MYIEGIRRRERRFRCTFNWIRKIPLLRSAATDFRHEEGHVGKKSICMVVSPLIMLMQDQSASFTTRGILARWFSRELDRGRDSAVCGSTCYLTLRNVAQ